MKNFIVQKSKIFNMLKIKQIIIFFLFSYFSLIACDLKGQNDNPDENEDLTTTLSGVKGFHIGFFLGAGFANNATASIYDGYGININGDKNTFIESYLYRKIVLENSGLNGQPDNIAAQLQVQPGEWRFDETDMPVSLKYKPAFLLGIHLNYGLGRKESILLNMNFARYTVTGNFTIITPKPPNANQYYQTIHTFPLRGQEQRMSMQLGYNRIFGNNKYVNFFAEAGLCINYAKLQKNFIQINELRLDLTSFSNQPGYNNYEPNQYTGWGFGVFGGMGLYFRLNSRYTATVVYNPTFEKINIGLNPKANIQHAIGLRVYYNL